MATLFPKIINYERTTGAYINGIWTPGVPSSLQFMGSVQPMSEKEIKSLTVGRQDTGKVKIYSNAKLIVSKESGDNAGDVVLWNDRKWEVIMEGNFENDLIPHNKYIAEYRGEI